MFSNDNKMAIGVRSLSETVRKRVHTDPTQFCSIVKNLGLHPDISSLHDWSTWLTPTGLKVRHIHIYMYIYSHIHVICRG